MWSRKPINNDKALIACVSSVTILSSYFNGALTVLLPTIQKNLHINNALLVWPFSLYNLTFACCLLLAGRAADVIGRSTCFLFGTAAFALLSFALALSPNFGALTAFSALLGIGGAILTPSGIGILGAEITGSKRNIAFAILGTGQVIGYLLGLFISAAFANSSWRYAFYLQGAVTALIGTASFFFTPKDQEVSERDRSIDWIGAALATTGLALLTFALLDSESAPKGWLTPYILAFLPVSIVLLGFFFWYEKKLEDKNRVPFLSIALLKVPHFIPILVISFLSQAAIQSVEYWVNLYFQLYKGYSAFQVALAFIPDIIAGSIFSFATGYFLNRLPGVSLITAGLLLTLPAALLFALIKPNLSYWAMSFPLLCLIAAPDIIYCLASVHIAKSADKKMQSMAGALFNVAMRLSAALSLAVTSTIANSVIDKSSHKDHKSALLDGYHATGFACAAFIGVGLLVALVFCRQLGIVGKSSDPVEEIELAPTTALPVERMLSVTSNSPADSDSISLRRHSVDTKRSL